MSDYPADIIATAGDICGILCIPSTPLNCEPIMQALTAERERCAMIIEHRPLGIPERQELAAYIRSGWHSLYAPAR